MNSGPKYATEYMESGDRWSDLRLSPSLLGIGLLFYLTATSNSESLGALEIDIGLLVIVSLGCFPSASCNVII